MIIVICSCQATIHDALVHPRLKIFWFEQLALLQELLGHTVEAGVVRLRIFQTMQRVRTVWPTLWAPRPALAHPDATVRITSLARFHLISGKCLD